MLDFDFVDDYAHVTCTGDDSDGCADDPALGTCDACGFVCHDIPTSAETAHDDLCCGSGDVCTSTDICVTHDVYPDLD